jgi:hypothetical protein
MAFGNGQADESKCHRHTMQSDGKSPDDSQYKSDVEAEEHQTKRLRVR